MTPTKISSQLLILLVLGIGAVSSCKTETESKKTSYFINLNKVKDSVSYVLEDILDDVELVKLETREECLFDRGNIFVTENYILVHADNKGVLQFSRKGSFIRTLIHSGKGPKEIQRIGWDIEEKTQTLFITDRNKQNAILSIDLRSGKFNTDIKKAIPLKCTEIHVLDNGNLRLVPSGYFSNGDQPFYFYDQDRQGNISRIAYAPDKWYNTMVEKTLFRINDKWMYTDDLEERIYQVQKDTLIPYLSFEVGASKKFNPANGDSFIYNSTIGHLLLFSIFNVEGNREWNGSLVRFGENCYYILDTERQQIYLHQNDSINLLQHSMNLHERDVRSHSNKLFSIKINTIDLIEIGESALESSTLPKSNRIKIKELLSGLSEEDNPVLIIGRT